MWSGHRKLVTWWWLEKIPSGCHYNLPAASSRDCSKWPWFLEKGHNIKMCTSDLQADFEHRSMVKVLILIASFSYSVFSRQTDKNTALRIQFLLPPDTVGWKYFAGHLTDLLCVLVKLDWGTNYKRDWDCSNVYVNWYSFQCVFIKLSFLPGAALFQYIDGLMTNLLCICQLIFGRLDSYMTAGQWPLFSTCVWHFDSLVPRMCM